MISLLDKDGNNKIDFQEFLSALNTLSFGQDRDVKLRFAFDVYDMDGDGKISNSDLFASVKMMVGKNLTDI